MTHRAQPLAAISTEKTIELVSLYFVFLNTTAASWICASTDRANKEVHALEGTESHSKGEIKVKSKFEFRDSPLRHPRTGVVTSKIEMPSPFFFQESNFL